MTKPFDAVLCKDVVVAAAESFFECSGQAFFWQRRSRNALRHRLSAASHTHGYSAFLPRPASHQSSLLPAGRFCNMFPEVPSPSRGSDFEFRLRSTQLSETMLVPEPPPIFPMLAVVLSSTWPCGSCAIAWAAAWMLLMPSSGWKPAWAAFPWISRREGNECRCRVGGCTDRAA